jgi:hypothetical protein
MRLVLRCRQCAEPTNNTERGKLAYLKACQLSSLNTRNFYRHLPVVEKLLQPGKHKTSVQHPRQAFGGDPLCACFERKQRQQVCL